MTPFRFQTSNIKLGVPAPGSFFISFESWFRHPRMITYLTPLSNESLFEFLAFDTKLAEMAKLASKNFTTAKKVTSSRSRPNDHWIKSLVLNHLS